MLLAIPLPPGEFVSRWISGDAWVLGGGAQQFLTDEMNPELGSTFQLAVYVTASELLDPALGVEDTIPDPSTGEQVSPTQLGYVRIDAMAQALPDRGVPGEVQVFAEAGYSGLNPVAIANTVRMNELDGQYIIHQTPHVIGAVVYSVQPLGPPPGNQGDVPPEDRGDLPPVEDPTLPPADVPSDPGLPTPEPTPDPEPAPPADEPVPDPAPTDGTPTTP